MTPEISKETQKIINSVMLSDNYKNLEECVVEGMKALKLKELNEAVEIGLDDLKQGKSELFDKDKIRKEFETGLKRL